MKNNFAKEFKTHNSRKATKFSHNTHSYSLPIASINHIELLHKQSKIPRSQIVNYALETAFNLIPETDEVGLTINKGCENCCGECGFCAPCQANWQNDNKELLEKMEEEHG